MRTVQILLVAAVLTIVMAACDRTDALTATPVQTRTPVVGTPTLTPDVVVKNRILEIFNAQVDAIQRGDWEAVYQTCSPSFRDGRSQEVFVRTALAEFARDGYTSEGFEARNIEPFIRAADRVRVRWDAYQNGQYVRTEEIGEVYIRVMGRWYDEGAWCR